MFRPEPNRCLDRRKSYVVLPKITNFHQIYATVILLSIFLHTVSSSPLGNGVSSPLRRLQIKNKVCSYSLDGRSAEGECMFNFECHQRHGNVVGTCIDGFLFGACCRIKSGAIDDTLVKTHEGQIDQRPGPMLSISGKKPTKYESTTKHRPLTQPVNNFIEQDSWVTEIYSVYQFDEPNDKEPVAPVLEPYAVGQVDNANGNEIIPLNMLDANGDTIVINTYIPSVSHDTNGDKGPNPATRPDSAIGVDEIEVPHEITENSHRNEIILPPSNHEQSLVMANSELVIAPRKNSSSHWVLVSSSVPTTEPTSKMPQVTENTHKTTAASYTEYVSLDGFNKIPNHLHPSTESFSHEVTTSNVSPVRGIVSQEEVTVHQSEQLNQDTTNHRYTTNRKSTTVEISSEHYPTTETSNPLNIILQTATNDPNIVPIISQLQGEPNNVHSFENTVRTTDNSLVENTTSPNSFKNENYLNEVAIHGTEADLLFWTTRPPLTWSSSANTEESTASQVTSIKSTTNNVHYTTGLRSQDQSIPVAVNGLIQNLIDKEDFPSTTPPTAHTHYEQNLISAFVQKTSVDPTFSRKSTPSLSTTTESSEDDIISTSTPPIDVNMLMQLLNISNYVPEIGYVIPSSLIQSSMTTQVEGADKDTENFINTTTQDTTTAITVTEELLANETVPESEPTSTTVTPEIVTSLPHTRVETSEATSTTTAKYNTTMHISSNDSAVNIANSHVEATSTRSDLTTTTSTTASSTNTTTTTQPLVDWDWRTTCGVRPLVRQGRIVNGRKSDFGEWPWQALIIESTWLGMFRRNKCGGVLLTEKYILTAAHCQPGFLASLIVILGELDVGGDYEPKSSVQRNVKRVIVHKDFIARTFDNDLALLELEKPVTFDEHILPICLPHGHDNFVGKIGFVSGWGRLSYKGDIPQKLHNVQVPVVPNHECQEWFREAGHSKVIKPEFICAGYKLGKKDSCEGDSGGPLSMRAEDGRWFLAGIVSHGIKCAFPNLPGVYMRMTYYRPWIEKVINS